MTKALESVVAERQRQDQLWGVNRQLDWFKWLAIIGEEFGECCNAALDLKSKDLLRMELVQMAAAAVAAVEDLDAVS